VPAIHEDVKYVSVSESVSMEPFSSEVFEQFPNGIAVEDCNGLMLRCNPALCRLTGYTAEELQGKYLVDLVQSNASPGTMRMPALREGTQSSYSRECIYVRKDRSTVWVKESIALIRDPLGQPAQIIAMVEDIAERKVAQQAKIAERAFVKAVVANVPAGLLVANAAGEIVLYNRVAAELFAISGTQPTNPRASWAYPLDADVLEADGVTPMPWDQRPLARTLKGETLKDFEQVIVPPNGEPRTLSVSTHRVVSAEGEFLGAVSISQDVTERKQAEASFHDLQRRLQDASHATGMAEVATNVLHNVGNALNSVNVSAGVLTAKVRHTKADGLKRLVTLLESNQHDLAAFLSAPGRSTQVLAYMQELVRNLDAEKDEVLEEVHSMQSNIDHIKAIVAMQQSYARQTSFAEQVDVTELVEDSLRINAGACQRHGVAVRCELEGTLHIVTQRHRVMQILVNLIRNAKYACDESGVEPKLMTLRAARSELGVSISVQDTGVGIPAENMERLFTHGFTTKPDGHGFGLHSAALAARELGGILRAHSEGPGLGASFTLDLPLHPPETANEA
jgi:PAS domain S-box-containing protein